MFKKIIPSTLIGRSIIIIFVPIIILVLITSLVFYQTSWNIISKRLAESVVADINVLVKLIDDDLEDYATNIPKSDFKMKINVKNNDTLIIYCREGVLSSPRVWWMFKYFGHKKVFVLDGGLKAWAIVNGKIKSGPNKTTQTKYKVGRENKTINLTYE